MDIMVIHGDINYSWYHYSDLMSKILPMRYLFPMDIHVIHGDKNQLLSSLLVLLLFETFIFTFIVPFADVFVNLYIDQIIVFAGDSFICSVTSLSFIPVIIVIFLITCFKTSLSSRHY